MLILGTVLAWTQCYSPFDSSQDFFPGVISHSLVIQVDGVEYTILVLKLFAEFPNMLLSFSGDFWFICF